MNSSTRREFIRRAGLGAVSLPVGSMAAASPTWRADDYVSPMAIKAARLVPKAKSVIFLFMYGGPSQVDTFDYKPDLYPLDGKTIKVKTRGRGGAKDQGPDCWTQVDLSALWRVWEVGIQPVPQRG